MMIVFWIIVKAISSLTTLHNITSLFGIYNYLIWMESFISIEVAIFVLMIPTRPYLHIITLVKKIHDIKSRNCWIKQIANWQIRPSHAKTSYCLNVVLGSSMLILKPIKLIPGLTFHDLSLCCAVVSFGLLFCEGSTWLKLSSLSHLTSSNELKSGRWIFIKYSSDYFLELKTLLVIVFWNLLFCVVKFQFLCCLPCFFVCFFLYGMES